MEENVTGKEVRVGKEASEIVFSTLETVRQKRCWALVVNDLQQFIDKDIDWNNFENAKKKIKFDEVNHYKIEIDPSFVISKGHSTASILESLKKLTEVWVHTHDPLTGENSYFILFPCYSEDNGKYYLHLSFLSLRWFIYLKKGNYISFHLNSFLNLSTLYSMNMYLFLSEYYNMDNREVIISVDDFKNKMGCPEGYEFKKIAEKVLTPSFKEFEKSRSLLTFICEPFSSKIELEKRSKGRKKIDMLKFTIIKRNDVK